MKTLYEMTMDFVELQNMLEENPEDTCIKDTIEALQLNFDQKALNTVALIKNINIPLESIDQEIKRLTAHKTAIKNNVQRLKDYIRDAMVETGVDEIKDDLIKIRLQKSESVEITDLDAIPEQYKTTKIEVVPDKTSIKKRIKVDIDIDGKQGAFPGAILKESKYIRIY